MVLLSNPLLDQTVSLARETLHRLGNGSVAGAATAAEMALSAKAAAHGRFALQIFASILAGWWLAYWIIWSFHNGSLWMQKIDRKTYAKFLGRNGATFLFQTATMILLVICGFAAAILRRKRNAHVKAVSTKARLNVWTTPVILRSPLGMLSLGDLISIAIVSFVMCWYMIKNSVIWAQEWDAEVTPEDPKRSIRITYVIGVEWGCVALIPMALLWIPVSRGSPILNVLGIPFERAVRYHVWLGLLTIWAVTLHGIFLIAYYIAVHEANVNGLFSWHPKEIAILPGLLSGIAGVVMLATALEYVRRKHYDLFFVAHHLYLLFLLFFSFHCAWCVDAMMIPILLFFLDRFFRAVQSRKEVDVLSAKVLTSGAIELTVAKPPRTNYHALSFIYVMLPSVSKLMWHPFSVASSPLDETNQIVIYIKPLGEFTENLHDQLISSKQYRDAGKKVFKCPFAFKVGVEGSYGSESMFYLRYQSLVLVAGGIGVTPFLAIIRDILHRYRLNQEYLPTNVELIFCVKAIEELHILDTIAPASILPGYQDHFRLTVHAFVTQESKEDVDAKEVEMNQLSPSKKNQGNMFQDEDIILYSESTQPVKEMSAVSSTGHQGWVFAVFAATIISYMCFYGIFSLKYQAFYDSGVVRTMIFMVCIFISVVIFGGGVMLIWSIFDKKARRKDAQVGGQRSPSPAYEKSRDLENSDAMVPLWHDNIVYGRRPVWEDVFNEYAKKYAGQNVGVMVSGLAGLQQDVADQCRRHSLRRGSTVVFHYHSVSFDL